MQANDNPSRTRRGRAALPRLLAVGVWLAGLAPATLAQRKALEKEDLTEMSIEELMNIEVTSVSKKKERSWETAAALSVLTGEDLERSGVRTIPDALRLVPGVHVARVDANKWAVSIRGFSNRFTNKLLVLMDGRSVYTPLFAGVYWDVQDTLLADLDRVEVIRGPGGTLWGANAVNGVINIITKNARETQGLLADVGGGDEERRFGAVRYGGKAGERVFYRFYLKYDDRDDGFAPDVTGPDGIARDDDANDDWDLLRGGFRADWEPGDLDTVTFQGDYYTGDVGETVRRGDHPRPFDARVRGGNLLGRWNHAFSVTSETTLQLYYDHTERSEQAYGERRDTLDVDFQHRIALPFAQELVWGAGYRLTSDGLSKDLAIALDDSRHDQLFSAFLQDEIRFAEDRLRFTVGTKVEHNDYSGFEIQPSARLLFLFNAEHNFWAAVSRAVRTPSRAGDGIVVTGPVDPRAIRSGGTDAEELLAYEAGYRARLADEVVLTLSAFFNRYDDLASVEPGEPEPIPDTCSDPNDSSTCTFIFPFHIRNYLEGDVYGAEVTANWRPLSWWHLAASYSFLEMELDRKAKSLDPISERIERSSPQHQASGHMHVELPWRISLDGAVRYVDTLPTGGVAGFRTTSRYVELDLRLARTVLPGLDASVAGLNLLHDHHREFREADFSPLVGTEVERSVHGKLTWRF